MKYLSSPFYGADFGPQNRLLNNQNSLMNDTLFVHLSTVCKASVRLTISMYIVLREVREISLFASEILASETKTVLCSRQEQCTG